MKRNILLITAALALGISAYLLGLAQGTNRGVKGSNTASILFFTAIHQALQHGDTQKAIKLSEDAIATHAGVIQTVEDHPQAGLYFLLPWMGDPLVSHSNDILANTSKYLQAYPQAVPAETISFLGRYSNNVK